MDMTSNLITHLSYSPIERITTIILQQSQINLEKSQLIDISTEMNDGVGRWIVNRSVKLKLIKLIQIFYDSSYEIQRTYQFIHTLISVLYVFS